ncbi:MAG: TonB family protein [Opitutaceae bacterium]|nr:TonB family protein [Opitutaceae bacterium]
MKIPHPVRAIILALLAGTTLVATAKVTPPRPVETPAPAYPQELEDTGQSGQAVIEMTITADGRVGQTRVESADHPAFGRAALAVLEQWRFEPARRDGEPIARKVVLPFQFRAPLDQRFNAMMGRKVFQHLPPDTEIIDEAQLKRRLRQDHSGLLKPGVALTQANLAQLNSIRYVPPVLPRSLQGREFEDVITVRCLVAPDGSVINPELEEMPKTAELAGPALLSVAAIRFHPPDRGDRAAYVRTTVTVDFSTANKPDNNLWWQNEHDAPHAPIPGQPDIPRIAR